MAAKLIDMEKSMAENIKVKQRDGTSGHTHGNRNFWDKNRIDFGSKMVKTGRIKIS